MITILLVIGFNIFWFVNFKKEYLDALTFKHIKSSIFVYGYNFVAILAASLGWSL